MKKEEMEQWRTGLHAANPQQAKALVERIDELGSALAEAAEGERAKITRWLRSLGGLDPHKALDLVDAISRGEHR